jgi:hypothetical protein
MTCLLPFAAVGAMDSDSRSTLVIPSSSGEFQVPSAQITMFFIVVIWVQDFIKLGSPFAAA